MSAAAAHPAYPLVDALEGPDGREEKTAAERGSRATLLAILGPTASGKSALALELARRLGGEIVNYDSVQLYRGFDIGSGKVRLEERRGVPHHLLDVLEPGQMFTAGDYRRAAGHAIESIRERNRLPILVGGTGFYLRALLLGLFEGPARSESLRQRLEALAKRRAGRGTGEPIEGRADPEAARAGVLHRLLERLDPASAARIHPRDRQKTIRALEVCLLARQPMSRMLDRGRSGLEGFEVIKVGLNPGRAPLYERIHRRVEEMFDAGLIEETRGILDRYPVPRLKPLEALGYRQASACLAGAMSREEAVLQSQAATRRYAKRQMTWFRRETDVAWFPGFGDDLQIQRQVLDWLGSKRNFQNAHA